MEEFGKIRWFIKKNRVSASLMHFSVSIDFCHNGENLYFPLKVYNDGKELLTFNFYTFEDAVGFTNNVINKKETVEEILETYQEMFSENRFDNPNEERVKGNSITLTHDEVDQAIVEYFGSGKEYPVSCKEELIMGKNGVDVVFYLVEHTRINGVRRDEATRLTKGDLMNALGAYIDFYGYELLDFSLNEIHRAGYFTDDGVPYYKGIDLKVRKKEKSLRLKRKDGNE